MSGNRWWRFLLIGAGWLFVGLGLMGAVLPLLPTTPFLLLAAACFARSSQRFYDWLHENKLFGEYLRRYRDGEGIPLRAKVVAITLIWVSLPASTLLVLPSHWWHLQAALFLVGVLVTVQILRTKTSR